MAVARVVSREHLDEPTPCAGWVVRDLLRHMAAQHRGFAASSGGRGGEPGVWDGCDAADPVADYLDACEVVLAAFADPGVAERSFELPEIVVGAPFPPAVAVSFHFVDYVVHGWDLACSIGMPFQPDPDVVEAARAVAEVVPTGKAREVAGAAFAPIVEIPAGGRAFDRVLALLGRDPAWSGLMAERQGKHNETDTPP